jgi:hypothetical protein
MTGKILVEYMTRYLSVILAITGCILLTASAWSVALPLGLAVAGASFFFLEWRLDAERDTR